MYLANKDMAVQSLRRKYPIGSNSFLILGLRTAPGRGRQAGYAAARTGMRRFFDICVLNGIYAAHLAFMRRERDICGSQRIYAPGRSSFLALVLGAAPGGICGYFAVYAAAWPGMRRFFDICVLNGIYAAHIAFMRRERDICGSQRIYAPGRSSFLALVLGAAPGGICGYFAVYAAAWPGMRRFFDICVLIGIYAAHLAFMRGARDICG